MGGDLVQVFEQLTGVQLSDFALDAINICDIRKISASGDAVLAIGIATDSAQASHQKLFALGTSTLG